MRAPITEQLDLIARQSVPFAITILLVVAGAALVPVPQYGALAPAAALMAAYYWIVYREDLMPAAAVFTIGVLQDVLEGTPLGLSALVLLLAFALIRSQARFLKGKSFILHWAGFVVFAVVVGVGKWLFMSLLSGLLIDPTLSLLVLALELALYPCMAWLLLKADSGLLPRRT